MNFKRCDDDAWRYVPQDRAPNKINGSLPVSSKTEEIDSLKQEIKSLKEKLRQEEIGIDTVRRSDARRSGVDPALAESILGHWHRERSVNERYGRVSDAELLAAVDAMTFDNGPNEIVVNS